MWKYWLRPLLVVVLGLFTLRSAILDWNIVPTGSMTPTILEGDYILVNKLAYDIRIPFSGWSLTHSGEPSRGDIVVFEPPGESDVYVKRVVGIPGDVIEIRADCLYVNGRRTIYREGTDPLMDVRPTLQTIRRRVMIATGEESHDWYGPVVVPTSHFFVLGDNRNNSKDSRTFGVVPRNRILGKATRILVSVLPSESWLPRLDRFFQPLA